MHYANKSISLKNSHQLQLCDILVINISTYIHSYCTWTGGHSHCVIVDNNPSSSLFIFNCTNKMTPTTQKALWDTDISTLNVGNFGNSFAFLQLIQLSKYTPSDHCCGHSENKIHMRDSLRVMFRCWTLLPLEIKIRRMFWNKFGPGGWWEKINVLHATAKTKMALQTRQDINFQGIFKKLGAESFLFVTFANLYLQNLHASSWCWYLV